MEVRELKVIYEPLRRAHHHDVRLDLSIPANVVGLAQAILVNEPVEVVGIFCLTTQLRLLCYHEVARGGLDRCPILPRDIFKPLMLVNAAKLILLHNHPSGDPTPSDADVVLTRRVSMAGDLLMLPLMDHVIIGGESHFSFHEAGLLAGLR